MECVKIAQLLGEYTTYTLPFIVFIYAVKTSYELIFKKGVFVSKRKNSVANVNEDIERFKELAQLRRELKPEYYFTEDFYNLFSKYQQTMSKDIEQFGEYVSLELDCLKLEPNKEKLKNEIRKVIVRIAEEDTKALLNDTYANAQNNKPVKK
ncbi:hypothetical protein M0802_006094 [Mischocyttarus mexicanus]|nr:hypothetical protein M0802_006094 [Mischocyttarus mexicanus]